MKLSNKWRVGVWLLLILIFTVSSVALTITLFTGCAALMTEQTYLLIDVPVKEEFIPSGLIYSMPEEKEVRKIHILGEGTVKNIDIYTRDGEFNWKEVKRIKDKVTFPIEITLVAYTDAVRILQRTVTGEGQIHTVEFYTVVLENQ